MSNEPEINIAGVVCSDCGGPVSVFAVPDKVWKGLGFTTEYACMACVAHRLNPDITPDQLGEEIYRQRRRFKLKNVNHYCGARIRHCGVAVGFSRDFNEMTKEQMENRGKP